MSECSPCKSVSCDEVDYFSTYNLQNPNADNPADDPSGTDSCAACKELACDITFEDLTIYGLQTNIVFNTDYITVTVPCPEGWTCNETVVVVYPPGTFVLPDPDPNDQYIAQGCSGLVVADTAEELFLLLAAQQAACDTVSNPPDTWDPPNNPPTPPPTQTFYNIVVTSTVTCSAGEELSFTGTAPEWISVDTSTGIITGAAGTFISTTSQADANTRAQGALDEWISTAQGDGSLSCQVPFENTLQTINCTAGNADYYHSYNAAIDGDGIYAIDGTVYVAAGYYTSTASQAAADAAALAAGQARFDAAVASNQILCCTEASTGGIVVNSEVGTQYTFVKTGSGYSYDISIVNNGVMGCFGSIYQPSISGQCTANYSLPLPDCAKGKSINVYLTTAGILDGWAAAAPSNFFYTVSFSGPIVSTTKARGAVRNCVPNGSPVDMAASSSGSVAIPNTAGTKYLVLTAQFSYSGIGPVTANIEIEVIP